MQKINLGSNSAIDKAPDSLEILHIRTQFKIAIVPSMMAPGWLFTAIDLLCFSTRFGWLTSYSEYSYFFRLSFRLGFGAINLTQKLRVQVTEPAKTHLDPKNPRIEKVCVST